VKLVVVCQVCGTVHINTGGTLGLTSVYGLGDRTLSRRRVEADLAVLRASQLERREHIEYNKQKLCWGVERYAKLPPPPELLLLEDVPSFWGGLGSGLLIAGIWFVVSYIAASLIGGFWPLVLLIGYPLGLTDSFGDPVTKGLNFILSLLVYGGPFVIVFGCLFPHFKASVANGTRPLENARRQKAYEEAVAIALKAAEPLKLAEDHLLKNEIRQQEGDSETVREKEEEVRRLLATL
jgi:hypothetical protein